MLSPTQVSHLVYSLSIQRSHPPPRPPSPLVLLLLSPVLDLALEGPLLLVGVSPCTPHPLVTVGALSVQVALVAQGLLLWDPFSNLHLSLAFGLPLKQSSVKSAAIYFPYKIL